MFLTDCILLNNKILDSFDYLGIAIKHKYNKENHLFKISISEENQKIVEAYIKNNLTVLDYFLDALLYIFDKTDSIVMALDRPGKNSPSFLITSMQQQIIELMIVMDSHEPSHHELYLEILQLKEILQILSKKLGCLKKSNHLSRKQLKIDLQDPIADLKLGRRQIVIGLKNLSNLQEKFNTF